MTGGAFALYGAGCTIVFFGVIRTQESKNAENKDK
jgi:hypothetical protein